jgi:predicted lipoprotein with Yx(FWY)xxD motif
MRFPVKLAVPSILAASLLLAACGSSSSNTTNATTSASNAKPASSSSAVVVKTAPSSLGTILVDSNGMTLYHLSAEKGGKFICTNSACTGIWHPLTVTAGSTPGGQVSSLGVIKRPDGTTQVTYKGSPLYTFASDQSAGETKGQGIKDVGTWTVITTTSGSTPASTTTPATTSTKSESSSESSSGGSGGYAY